VRCEIIQIVHRTFVINGWHAYSNPAVLMWNGASQDVLAEHI